MLGFRKKKRPGHESFAQCGEDLILDFVLTHILRIERPYYVDIGAHDPVKFSNTYHFYLKGLNGVLIEPSAAKCEKLRKARPRDRVIHAGISSADGAAEYFRMDADTLNTFDAGAAERYQSDGHKLLGRDNVKLVSPRTLAATEFERTPDLLSIDVEGYEHEILKAWDFVTCRPAALCIETLPYSKDPATAKNMALIAAVQAVGYAVYADTFINTIFLDKQRWLGTGILPRG